MSFLIQRSFCQLRLLVQVSQHKQKQFHDDFSLKPELAGSRQTKFKIFTNEEATEILDVEEERQKIDSQTISEHESIYQNLNLLSMLCLTLKLFNTELFLGGLSGVFEIEDLVDVLKKDNACDVFVCSVPKEIKYVDYMCICSGNR